MRSKWGRAPHTMSAAHAGSFQHRISRRPAPMRHPSPALVVPNARSHWRWCGKGEGVALQRPRHTARAPPDPAGRVASGGHLTREGRGPAEAERRGGGGEGGRERRRCRTGAANQRWGSEWEPMKILLKNSAYEPNFTQTPPQASLAKST
jgi:hypothetical protein